MREKGNRTGHGQPAWTHIRKRHPIRSVLLSYQAWRVLSRFRPCAADHYRSNRRHHRHYASRVQMEKRP